MPNFPIIGRTKLAKSQLEIPSCHANCKSNCLFCRLYYLIAGDKTFKLWTSRNIGHILHAKQWLCYWISHSCGTVSKSASRIRFVFIFVSELLCLTEFDVLTFFFFVYSKDGTNIISHFESHWLCADGNFEYKEAKSKLIDWFNGKLTAK